MLFFLLLTCMGVMAQKLPSSIIENCLSMFIDDIGKIKENFFEGDSVYFEKNNYLKKNFKKRINGKNVIILSKCAIREKVNLENKTFLLNRLFIDSFSKHQFKVTVSISMVKRFEEQIGNVNLDMTQFYDVRWDTAAGWIIVRIPTGTLPPPQITQ